MKRESKGLRSIGIVQHIVDNKLITRGNRMKAEQIVNSIVTTNDKRKIGRVYDVFGPVNRPYVSVKAFKSVKEKQLRRFTNKEIFVL